MSANEKELCHPRTNDLSRLHSHLTIPDFKVANSFYQFISNGWDSTRFLVSKLKMNKKKAIIYNKKNNQRAFS